MCGNKGRPSGLLSVEDVDGGAEFVALVFFHLAAVDEGLEIGVGIGGWVEFAGGLFEVGNELGRVFEVGDGAAGSAGDAADETLGATLTQHATGGGVVGVNDDSVRNHATERGVGMGGGIKHLGVNAADPFLGITGLDGGVAASCDADPAHGEEAGRGLGVAGAEAALASAATEGFFHLAGAAVNDVNTLGGGVDDVEPLGVVVGVAGLALGGDGGFDGGPIRPEKFGGGGGRGVAGGTGLQEE